MLEPRPAVVRPRVVVPGVGTTLLEDEVLARLQSGWTGLVGLFGPRGSGRSTALDHLAHIFGDDPRLVLIDCSPESRVDDAWTKLVICSSLVNYRPQEVWHLEPWSLDDCIEYLLATHRECCASVIERLQDDLSEFVGLPELCRAVLDRMAADKSLFGVRRALRAAVESQLSGSGALQTARESCFTIACRPEQENRQEIYLRWSRRINERAFRLLRHEPVRLLLAADYLADELRSHKARKLLMEYFPERLVRETAEQIRGNSHVIKQLEQFLVRRTRLQQAMAASLLHAAGTGWVPQSGNDLDLTGAYLSKVRWAGVQLEKLELTRADLRGADLSESRLQRFAADGAVLSGAKLHGAQLNQFSADLANLAAADLSFVRAPKADFRGASLRERRLEGALLKGAIFTRADLSGARFVRANLVGADFVNAKLDEADFNGADLSSATLGELPLKRACFVGAQFNSAFLGRCDMECMNLPGASFVEANLIEALLTASRIPDGQFRGANLRGARLAEIDWERADLRDADLSGCTFHLGSSRSGLVGSPIACEGSRTGFYTDEYHEQDFKAPEEIRKANLRGADLRGAKIDHTDFYLVDLRNARFTPEQEEHFRACKAILETRVT